MVIKINKEYPFAYKFSKECEKLKKQLQKINSIVKNRVKKRIYATV